MASGVFDDILIQHLWSTEEFRNIFNDRNRLQKWYDFEAAFALEQGELGIIPKEAAADIAANCKISKIDVEAVAAEIRRIKHPLVPAVKAVQKLCKGDNGEYIHFGPTTQDVLDTAVMLQIKEAHALYLRDMKAIGNALVKLCEQHRDTPMVGNGAALRASASVGAADVCRRYGRCGRHPGVLRAQSQGAGAGGDETAGAGRCRHQLAAGA